MTMNQTARIALSATGPALTVYERATLAADAQTDLDLTMTFQFNRWTQGFVHAYRGSAAIDTDDQFYRAGFEAGLAA